MLACLSLPRQGRQGRGNSLRCSMRMEWACPVTEFLKSLPYWERLWWHSMWKMKSFVHHNPTATTAQSSFHGTSMSIFQHPNSKYPGEECEPLKLKQIWGGRRFQILLRISQYLMGSPPCIMEEETVIWSEHYLTDAFDSWADSLSCNHQALHAED